MLLVIYNFATFNKIRKFVVGKEFVGVENHDLLLKCDNENILDNLNKLENENVGGDVVTEPEVGMMFNSVKEILDFYKRYAYTVDLYNLTSLTC